MIYSHNQLICWNELTSYYTRQKDLALDGALSQRFVITFRLKKNCLNTYIWNNICRKFIFFFLFPLITLKGIQILLEIKHIRVLNDNDSVTHSPFFHWSKCTLASSQVSRKSVWLKFESIFKLILNSPHSFVWMINEFSKIRMK